MINLTRTAPDAWLDVQVAQGHAPADLLLKNCIVVNVYSRELHRADIAVRSGMIVAVRENYGGDAIELIDAMELLAAPMPVIASAEELRATACSTFCEVRLAQRKGETVLLQGNDRQALVETLQELHETGIDCSQICLPNEEALNATSILVDARRVGFDFPQIFEMASLNPAVVLQIDHQVGSIAPGRRADIVLFEEPGIFSRQMIYSAGKLVEGRVDS